MNFSHFTNFSYSLHSGRGGGGTVSSTLSLSVDDITHQVYFTLLFLLITNGQRSNLLLSLLIHPPNNQEYDLWFPSSKLFHIVSSSKGPLTCRLELKHSLIRISIPTVSQLQGGIIFEEEANLKNPPPPTIHVASVDTFTVNHQD